MLTKHFTASPNEEIGRIFIAAFCMIYISDFRQGYPMRRQPLPEPPVTYRCNAAAMRDELDYEDMIALSGMFRRWAIYEEGFTSEQRTGLIAWSADFERLAVWVGKGWRAANPPEKPLLKFIATLERNASRAINLQHAKHWLGLD